MQYIFHPLIGEGLANFRIRIVYNVPIIFSAEYRASRETFRTEERPGLMSGHYRDGNTLPANRPLITARASGHNCLGIDRAIAVRPT